ncbi:putative leupaxin isoform X1 [Penaeus vannamei]|uniref:Putative leupaxin isoform X1 n=1 Tax=Penaeus vannamei TaxID=6689 RepID=A0A3R7QYB5_PENVA|nr:putative leupaxin isoform X1 [Penaeus vannamei]
MHGRAEKTHHRLHRLAARANDHITLDPRNTRTDTRPRSTILTRKQSRNKFFARKDTNARTRHLAGTPQTNTDGRGTAVEHTSHPGDSFHLPDADITLSGHLRPQPTRDFGRGPARRGSQNTPTINASTLQTQVDSAYAKPQKSAKSPSPPAPAPAPLKEPTPPKEPSPTPTPPQPNQLDSMLGSLASHMTEQGITTTQKGCCSACDKPIVGQVITALGKTWHPEHFTCAHCNQELGTKNFFERDGRPYCEVDYHNLFSPRCAYCNGPILDKCVTALDTTWHPEHFFCAQCGNTFGDDGFHEKDGKPYCRDDYFNMFAPKCGGCNAPIMDNYISALNAQWHPECFVCRDCRQPFNGGSFFDHEGMPYCETHYHAKRGSLCAGCHKPITGRCITAMFRKFHPEHFVCSFCLKQLNKGTFKEQNDKPYCHGCFDKLFG